jgi:hypothetical protein
MNQGCARRIRPVPSDEQLVPIGMGGKIVHGEEKFG